MLANNKPTKGILRRDGNYDPNIPVFMQVPKKVKISYEKGAFVEDQTKEDEINRRKEEREKRLQIKE